MCTAAYREALTRDLPSAVSSAPPSTSAPSQRYAAEAGREAVASWPLRRRTNSGQDDLESRGIGTAGAVAESASAITLAKDATVVNGEVIDQR
jgi:hypothetical protein